MAVGLILRENRVSDRILLDKNLLELSVEIHQAY
jgi:hypothetical protein